MGVFASELDCICGSGNLYAVDDVYLNSMGLEKEIK